MNQDDGDPRSAAAIYSSSVHAEPASLPAPTSGGFFEPASNTALCGFCNPWVDEDETQGSSTLCCKPAAAMCPVPSLGQPPAQQKRQRLRCTIQTCMWHLPKSYSNIA